MTVRHGLAKYKNKNVHLTVTTTSVPVAEEKPLSKGVFMNASGKVVEVIIKPRAKRLAMVTA